jgi:ferredoxin
MVMVLEGAEALTPMGHHEAQVLARNVATPGVRLSCQTKVEHPRADVLIQTGYW